MKTKIISTHDAINWTQEHCPYLFNGIKPGFLCKVSLQGIKDGVIRYASADYTNDLEIKDLLEYNDLGITSEVMMCKGFEPTGNIVFCGYVKEDKDWTGNSYYKEVPLSVACS